MAQLYFTQHLRRFVEAPAVHSSATTLRGALEEAFLAAPQLQGYVLDDQKHLRKHLVVFIDGRRVRDYEKLDDTLRPDSEVHVLQALTGG